MLNKARVLGYNVLMSFNRIKQNKHTLLVCSIMIFAFVYFLVSYQDYIINTLNNEYHIVNGDEDPNSNGVDYPIEYPDTNTGTTTPGVSTTTPNIKKPIQVGHEIGIAAGSKLVGLSDEALDAEMAGISALGAKWVRFDVEWGFVQYSSPLKYDWSKYDKIVNALEKYNLKGLIILTYSPEWARVPGCRGGSHCPPADPKTFAEFAGEAVKRYKKKNIHYWEIWNEPNSYDFWATKSDCVAYTQLLKETYPVMKKFDSEAFVITGGVAQVGTTDVNIAPLEFIECIYKNGGKNYFDAIGFHPYTFPKLPSENINNGWGRMGLGTKNVRKIMAQYTDSSKKIWMTEFGAPTGGPDPAWFVTEEDQARTYEDAINLYRQSSWAGPLFIYTYLDSGNEPTSNENFFGLVRFDGSLKPAYKKLQELIYKGI